MVLGRIQIAWKDRYVVDCTIYALITASVVV